MRRLLVATLVAFAALPAAAATPQSDPKRLTVRSGGKAVAAAMGTQCRYAEGAFEPSCVPAEYPLADAPRLTVRRGGEVKLTSRLRPDRVGVRLARVRDGEEVVRNTLRARRIPGTKAGWRFRLPRRMGNARILGILVTKGGDQVDYEVRLRLRR